MSVKAAPWWPLAIATVPFMLPIVVSGLGNGLALNLALVTASIGWLSGFAYIAWIAYAPKRYSRPYFVDFPSVAWFSVFIGLAAGFPLLIFLPGAMLVFALAGGWGYWFGSNQLRKNTRG